MKIRKDIEIQNNNNDSPSESDNLDFNVEEEEIFEENIIESKNIRIQNCFTSEKYYSTRYAKEVILDNPLEFHIKDSLLKKSLLNYLFSSSQIIYINLLNIQMKI